MSRHMRRAVAVALATALLVAGTALAAARNGPDTAGQEPRDLLLILLDAVPYTTALAAVAGNGDGPPPFADFHHPVPLVSTFPSTTGVAFGEIFAGFGLEPSPGYESRFFDWDRREKVGGGPISYHRHDFPWREFFDWKRKGVIRNAFGAVRPVRSSMRALHRALDDFVRSDDPTFLVYVSSTDAAAHLRGPDELLPTFAELDRLLAETRASRSDRPFDTVILSDHGIDGGEPLINVRAGVRAALKGAGFSLGDRLRRPGDAVLTPYGLVSSFEIYTAPEDEERAATAAVSAAGVDLCVYATDGGWSVVGSEGSGRIRRHPGVTTAAETSSAATRDVAADGDRAAAERLREAVGTTRATRRSAAPARGPSAARSGAGGPEWAYTVQGEDPLELPPPLANRMADGDVWIPDLELFRATADGHYPDPFHRIAAAFELVENPASVVCSLAPGHMYGARTTALAARFTKGRLRWTHGALYREASVGFLMTDALEWRPNSPVRAARALQSFTQYAEKGAQR